MQIGTRPPNGYALTREGRRLPVVPMTGSHSHPINPNAPIGTSCRIRVLHPRGRPCLTGVVRLDFGHCATFPMRSRRWRAVPYYISPPGVHKRSSTSNSPPLHLPCFRKARDLRCATVHPDGRIRPKGDHSAEAGAVSASMTGHSRAAI